MNTSGDMSPQRVLTPRRKRAFLSFRRKSDLLWFAASLILFSGGTAAFILAVYFVHRAQTPMAIAPQIPAPVIAPAVPPALPAPPPSPSAVDAPPAGGPNPRPSSPKSAGNGARGGGDPRPVKRPVAAKIPPAPVVKKIESRASGYFLLQQGGPFKSFVDRRAKIAVDRVDDSYGEPAVQLTYDLSQGDWVQCFVNVRENFSNYTRVQFLFKGEGAKNTLEFKIVDSDGTNVGALWSQQTAKKAWTVVDLPLSELTYLWGGDPLLDFRRVRQIFFAVSKKSGDKGGRGRVTLRGIKFL
ncbi:MAG: hypothetical protein IPN90_06620 [Elusimicrobia bacterium]|nr:hypothetical protein [Elusimicrobiota bacterium]